MSEILNFPHPTRLELSTYVDDETSKEDTKRITDHIQKCGLCEVAVNNMRQVDKVYADAMKKRREKKGPR